MNPTMMAIRNRRFGANPNYGGGPTDPNQWRQQWAQNGGPAMPSPAAQGPTGPASITSPGPANINPYMMDASPTSANFNSVYGGGPVPGPRGGSQVINAGPAGPMMADRYAQAAQSMRQTQGTNPASATTWGPSGPAGPTLPAPTTPGVDPTAGGVGMNPNAPAARQAAPAAGAAGGGATVNAPPMVNAPPPRPTMIGSQAPGQPAPGAPNQAGQRMAPPPSPAAQPGNTNYQMQGGLQPASFFGGSGRFGPMQPAPASPPPANSIMPGRNAFSGVGAGPGLQPRQPMAMARGGITAHIRHARPMHAGIHPLLAKRGGGMPPPPPEEGPMPPIQSPSPAVPSIGGPPGAEVPQYAEGGFPRASTIRATPFHSGSNFILANPVPMARQMARYRSQGGPMSRIEKPMTSNKFAVNMGKSGMRPFPMPRSEAGSISNPAYQ